jgi:uncharacterized protein YciI
MTPLPAFPRSNDGTWGQIMTERAFDFEAMTRQGNSTDLPELYVMVMTPLPIAADSPAPEVPDGMTPLEWHYSYMHRLIADGKVLVIGPCMNEPQNPGDAPVPHGIGILRAATREDAEEIAANEPFHLLGWRRNDVMAWTVKFGTLIPALRSHLDA